MTRWQTEMDTSLMQGLARLGIFRDFTTSELVEYAKPAVVRAGKPAATKNVGEFEI